MDIEKEIVEVVEKEKFSAKDLEAYTKLPKQYIVDLSKNTRTTSSYSIYTREQLYQYLQSPGQREQYLRNASIYFYNTSSHYRRLIEYYAFMSMWMYTISPVGLDTAKIDPAKFRKQYLKAVQLTERMNLKHEMAKAALVTFREGVFYGAIHSNNSSWFIQKIDPDICQITSIEDGCWMYAVDCSQLSEDKLMLYPEEFAGMYNNYLATGEKWQEVPSDICFCLKADESSAAYSIPPWAAVMPLLYDIDNYKQIQEAASNVNNYKMLGMKIPLDDEGTPLISYDMVEKYYQHLCNALPDYIGAAAVPMDLTAYNFDNSSVTSAVDEVTRSEEQYWAATGTSSLLFGSAKNTSATALKLSIHADEEIVIALMNQCERVINRLLKSIGGTIKFRITFLPVTIYNQADMVKLYKEGATYGLAKSAYAATLNLLPNDTPAMNYIEMEMMKMGDLIPLSSSHTQSSDEVGRPTAEETGDDLTEAGEGSREGDADSDKTIV